MKNLGKILGFLAFVTFCGLIAARHISNNMLEAKLLNSGYTPLEVSCIMSVTDAGPCDKVYAANQVQLMLKSIKGVN